MTKDASLPKEAFQGLYHIDLRIATKASPKDSKDGDDTIPTIKTALPIDLEQS